MIHTAIMMHLVLIICMSVNTSTKLVHGSIMMPVQVSVQWHTSTWNFSANFYPAGFAAILQQHLHFFGQCARLKVLHSRPCWPGTPQIHRTQTDLFMKLETNALVTVGGSYYYACGRQSLLHAGKASFGHGGKSPVPARA
jgi:hypothetical protein